MTVSLLTRNRDGSDPRWVSQIGTYAELIYAATTPGGSTTLQFQFGQKLRFTHQALRQGRLLDAYCGTVHVWGGQIDSPQRGAPWTVSATGNAGWLKNYTAQTGVQSATAQIYNLPNIISAAQSRGLSLTVAGVLNAVSGTGPEGTTSVDDSLAQLVTQGGIWQVTPDGALTTPVIPSVPALIVKAVSTPGSRTYDGYANVIVVSYTNSSTTLYDQNLAVGTAAEIGLYGRVEYPLDLTALGVLNASAAAMIAAAVLGQMSGAPPFTAPITAGVGQLFTAGGAPVNPKVVPAMLPAMVQVQLVDPDTAFTTDTPSFVIGEASVDVDANTVQLTPLGATRSDFSGLLAKFGHQASR